ncbi:hypothetical protein CALCODRAFT_59968 [Calocera cornea HHB12733]|uniref:Uncharacterized protein n=1 Tax=Calocera cornea HHB12733 TaxID=1353952 RepID=A0A165DNT6_9BASI|nr:hypothetical protein CALCODRAFT_59968 [Calocera cornea HHB12733]
MRFASPTDIETADGAPTKEVLLLRDKPKRRHWLRTYGHRLLSKDTQRGLPQEVWRITADFLENERKRCSWHLVAGKAFSVRNGHRYILLQELPSGQEVYDMNDFEDLEQQLMNHTTWFSGKVLSQADSWELRMDLLGDPTGPSLFHRLEPADITQYILNGYCSSCLGQRAVHRYYFFPKEKAMWPVQDRWNAPSPRIACPNCMGREVSENDFDIVGDALEEGFFPELAPGRKQSLNSKLRELGYDMCGWSDHSSGESTMDDDDGSPLND